MKKIEHNTMMLVFLVDICATKHHIKDVVKRLYDMQAAQDPGEH